MRVLAVLDDLGLLEDEGQGRREQRVLDGGGAVGPTIFEPGHDGRVIGRGVGEGLGGERPAGRLRERTAARDLRQHGVVVVRADHDADVGEVLRRGTHHGRTPDVDQLDRGVRGERIEVAHDEIDRLDVVGLEVGEVLGLRAVGQDAAVDLRVQGLDPAAEHLGALGDRGHVLVGDPSLREGGRGLPGGDQLDPRRGESAGEVDQSGLVVDAEQGSHGVVSFFSGVAIFSGMAIDSTLSPAAMAATAAAMVSG